MPLTIKRLTKDEAASEFKRTGSNLEKLDEYVDALRGMDVGEAITVKISGQFMDEPVLENGKPTDKTIQKWVEFVPDTADEDGEMDTVRTFKRRMNASAVSLGFKLKWKNKGHREGEGEDSRFVLDWLSGLAITKDTETDDDGVSAGK